MNKRQITVAIVFFILGISAAGLGMYLYGQVIAEKVILDSTRKLVEGPIDSIDQELKDVEKEIEEEKEDIKKQVKALDKFFDSDDAKDIEEMGEKFFKNFKNEFYRLDKEFNMGFNTSAQIKAREDKENVYYDIFLDGYEKESIKVRVQGDVLTLTGEVNKKTEDTVVTSTFTRSMSVPPGVDAEKVSIDTKKDRITLTFPRKS